VRDLRTDLYGSIIGQPLAFLSRYSTGELMSRVSSDVEKVQTAVSETLAELLKQMAILVALLVLIFSIDWVLSLVSLVLVPFVFLPSLWFGRRLRRLSRTNQSEIAGMSRILFETFSGSRIVKVFTMEPAERERFRTAASRVFRLSLKVRLTHALSSPLMEILGIFVVAGFLMYARTRIQGGELSSGMFVTFIFALIKLYDPVRRMSGINNSFQQAIGASTTLFEIMNSPPETNTGRTRIRGLASSIDFVDVVFSYTGDVRAIDGVSFTLARGEVLALVGSSGAGKTTLVNLLPRFYDVDHGRITIDGVDLHDIELMSLRRQIAMVTQDVVLFDDTVRANIRYGNPAAGDDAVRAAAEAALVDDFVERLPRGYDTVVGERGLRLSGGERQRISIARALLKDAPILILDEATSSLDTEAESLVQRAIENLIEGRTTIVIAHRLSTIRRADRILVLGDGRIQEEGTHEELLRRHGVYWKLHKMQFEDATP
jgi:subfamily B ATP-binding cassette protein MsbA